MNPEFTLSTALVSIRRSLRRGRTTLSATVAVATALLAAPLSAAPPGPNRPRLVVLVVVDQLRGDYPVRFEPWFGDDGFRRIERDGVYFANAYYDYLCSATGPGHATIATGATPRVHGIVANKWPAEPGTVESVQAVYDPGCEAVPPGDSPGRGRSPHRLCTTTLGDQMKLADQRTRVVSVALKDRAAIFLGGRLADVALWWDFGTGEFVSSTWYGAELPAYVRSFNEAGPTKRFANYVWNPLAPEAALAGCYPLEPDWHRIYQRLGHAFPHALPPADSGFAFNGALWSTPAGNDLVIDLVERVLKEDSLGADDAPDLLCVGLSSNDLVGHFFGPQSAEVADMTVQTDRQIARLLSLLDERVGRGRYLLALTGDHGVTATPPIRERLGIPGGVLDERQLARELNEHLASRFFADQTGDAPRPIVIGIEVPWVYFNRPLLEELDSEKRGEFFDAAVKFLSAQAGVAAVYGPDALAGTAPSVADEDRLMAWNSFNAGHSGQICIRLASYWEKKDGNLAGHSSGSRHDRHVPIMLLGPGISGGRRYEPARPTDIAVTLAALLGIEAPIGATGRVLHEALARREP